MNLLYEPRKTKSMGMGLFALQSLPENMLIPLPTSYRYYSYDNLIGHPYFCKALDGTHDRIIEFAMYMAYLKFNPNPQQKEKGVWDYVKELPNVMDGLVVWENRQLEMLHGPIKEKIKQKLISIKLQFQQMKALLLSKNSTAINSNYQNTQQTLDKQQKLGRLQQQLQEYQPEWIASTTSLSQFVEIIEKITFEVFLHFYACIESRHVYLPTSEDQQSRVGALAPIIELINHSTNENISVQHMFGQFRVSTIKPIQKDEQLFVNYGKGMSQEDMLEFYGMLSEDLQLQENSELEISQNGSSTYKNSHRQALAKKYNAWLANSNKQNVGGNTNLSDQ